jgi:hypothetical protein
MSRPAALVGSVVVGVCVAVVTFVAGWAALIMVEVVAGSGDGLSFLPPPVAIRLPISGGLAVVAIAGGLVVSRQRARAQRRSWGVPVLSGLLVVALLGGIGLSAHAYTAHHEKRYLARLHGIASRQVLLRDGHQACDWLTDRRWGTPPARQSRRPPTRLSLLLGSLRSGRSRSQLQVHRAALWVLRRLRGQATPRAASRRRGTEGENCHGRMVRPVSVRATSSQSRWRVAGTSPQGPTGDSSPP